MVRIGLMVMQNFPTSRRRFLGGLAAATTGVWTPRTATAATGETVSLQAKAATLSLQPGQPETPVSALVGPGPELRFRQGARQDVALQNTLTSPIVVNWRGLDGVPSAEPLTAQAPVTQGAKATLSLPLRHAGTLLADIGLLGHATAARALPLIVDESDPQGVDRDEIVLIEDWWLRSDGTTASPGSDPGDATPVYTVNGLISPDLAVHSNERVRLRLINACQRHVIAIKIDGLEVRVMALDGQPAEPFVTRNSAVVLAPGGRSDVYLDVHLQPGSNTQILLHDGKQARRVAGLAIRDGVAPRASAAAAPALPSNGLPARLDLKGAQRVDLALSGNEWVAPATFAVSTAPAFRTRAGRVIVLALRNQGTIATVFHLHGHHFRLLDRLDDGWKPYWLDTLAIEPGQTQRIAFAAEYPGRYLLESTATDWAAPRLLRWYSVE